MKLILSIVCLFYSLMVDAQGVSQKSFSKIDLTKLNDSVAALIPQKIDGKYGFINQKGQVIIPHKYSNVGFFTEDCLLKNSSNKKVRKFGTADYASVRRDDVDFRIDKSGKEVYRYKDSDLGKCPFEYKAQLYHAYMKNGFFGIIEDSKFNDESDYRQYTIYPQYQMLHIMEGDDLRNPMIVAVRNNKFGVINLKNEVIIPFIYEDIKLNYSWKLARLFQVSTDGKNYYYVDNNNHAY